MSFEQYQAERKGVTHTLTGVKFVLHDAFEREETDVVEDE
jgi:hypothetical protein